MTVALIRRAGKDRDTHRRDPVKTLEEATHKPRRQTSGETTPLTRKDDEEVNFYHQSSVHYASP